MPRKPSPAVPDRPEEKLYSFRCPTPECCYHIAPYRSVISPEEYHREMLPPTCPLDGQYLSFESEPTVMPGHPIPARPDRSRETLQTFVGREAIIQRHRAWIRTVREAIAEFDDEVNEAEVCNRFACKEDIPDRFIIADVGRLERSAEITRDKLSRVLLDWSQRP